MSIYYPYSEFIEDLETLTETIDRDFDTIIPIARGGLTIAHLLSSHYNIREVYAINSISYDNDRKLDSVDIFNIPNLKESRKVLIVDDIVDSGDTLIAVLNTLKGRYPNVIFYSASIFYKKSAKIAPTWYVKEANRWIDFFWEKDLKDKNGFNDRQL
jgi:xanthine phosphoribosyltransferase